MLRKSLALENIKKGIKRPTEAIDETLFEVLYRAPATYINTKTTIGTNVFSLDWDVLVILDTCRVDALREVADEYSFLKNIGRIRSAGGRSPEWIAKTFEKQYSDQIRDTAYLSANVFAEKILVDHDPETVRLSESTIAYKQLRKIPTVDVEDLGKFEYLYTYESVGEEGPLGHKEGGTPPRYVTDRGIAVGRQEDFSRIILHYLQPHPPYAANAIAEDRDLHRYEKDWWGYLADTGDRETIWNAYLDELRSVLDEVEILLNNLDVETVALSADHGESFGEYWEHGHKTGSLNPYVRYVPWVTMTASDKNTYEPRFEAPSSQPETRKEDQLKALGYRM